jgi:hypothetical protein
LQTAYINRVETAVPPYDVHDAFRRFAQSRLNDDRRNSLLFQRMAAGDRLVAEQAAPDAFRKTENGGRGVTLAEVSRFIGPVILKRRSYPTGR